MLYMRVCNLLLLDNNMDKVSVFLSAVSFSRDVPLHLILLC